MQNNTHTLHGEGQWCQLASSSKMTLFCCAAVVAMAAAASAADLPAVAPPLVPPPLPVENWTGFYVGFGGGMSSLNNKLSALPGPDPNCPASPPRLTAWEPSVTSRPSAQDMTINSRRHWWPGVFGDYDFHHLKSSINVDIAAIPVSARGEISADRQWSIGGRLGYLTSPSTLVFLGYTQLSLSNLTATVSGPFPAISVEAQVPRIAGGFIGAGIETKLTSNISLRGELRRARADPEARSFGPRIIMH